MADNNEIVRVHDAEGRGFKLTRKDAEAYVKAHPGTEIEGPSEPEDDPDAAEVARRTAPRTRARKPKSEDESSDTD